MVPCVETPGGGRRGRRLGLLHGVLHALDRRGTDLHLAHVLEFPGQPFRAQPWLRLNELTGLLFHLPREAPGGPAGGRPFGQAGQLIAVAQALDGAG